MAKRKEIQTIHPLRIAESLEKQNNALSALFSRLRNLTIIVDLPDIETIKKQIRQLIETAEETEKIIWPE